MAGKCQIKLSKPVSVGKLKFYSLNDQFFKLSSLCLFDNRRKTKKFKPVFLANGSFIRKVLNAVQIMTESFQYEKGTNGSDWIEFKACSTKQSVVPNTSSVTAIALRTTITDHSDKNGCK